MLFLKCVCKPWNFPDFLTSPTSAFLQFLHQILSDLDGRDMQRCTKLCTFLCSPVRFLQVFPALYRKYICVPLLNIQNIFPFFYRILQLLLFFYSQWNFGYFFCNPVWCVVFPLRMTTSRAGLLPGLQTKVSAFRWNPVLMFSTILGKC